MVGCFVEFDCRGTSATLYELMGMNSMPTAAPRYNCSCSNRSVLHALKT